MWLHVEFWKKSLHHHYLLVRVEVVVGQTSHLLGLVQLLFEKVVNVDAHVFSFVFNYLPQDRLEFFERSISGVIVPTADLDTVVRL